MFVRKPHVCVYVSVCVCKYVYLTFLLYQAHPGQVLVNSQTLIIASGWPS